MLEVGEKTRLDFVIIGSQKAGTTWIYEYLKTLPGVCFPAKVKETFFFDIVLKENEFIVE